MEKRNNGLVLGLDIGVTSVGYGIVNRETGEAVDFGVRLFSEWDPANNQNRRAKRSGRRLHSRRKNRLQDMKKILVDQGMIPSDYAFHLDPYALRVKGLSEKLTDEELATVLYNLAKLRGSSLETVEDTEEVKNDNVLSSKNNLKINDALIKSGKYICQIQQERLSEKGKLRGHINNFRTKDYVVELKQILSNQGKSKDFNDYVENLIVRRRDFSDGPGSQKSPTPYGRWLTKDQEEPIDLIEKMRGKCSYYPDQLRCAKMAYKADLFNLLNDLNNLSVKGEKLEREQKEQVIEYVNEKGSIKPKQLAKLLGLSDIDDISGFRIDKSDKPILTEFKGYTKVKKVLENSGLYHDHELVDQIIDVLTRDKVVERRANEIRKLSNKFSEEEIEALANLTQISGYHSMSAKAINEFNKEMLISPLNQMQIITNRGNQNDRFNKLKGMKEIHADDTAILSPVAKRAQREAMKVVNRLRELYGEFDSIVVETTRAKNSQEQKTKIKESQAFFEKEKKRAQQIVDENKYNLTVNAKLIQKLRLYAEQNCKTAYALMPIDLDLLISDPTAFEVDHIIPISISYDDSFSNKVLVTRWENQIKGNLTPLHAHKNHKFGEYSDLASYIANVNDLRKMNGMRYEKKKNLLLSDEDLTKFDTQKKFIARNIVDTAYAERVVLNTLQDYFRANEISTVVNTVKGNLTHMFRNKIHLDKERSDIDTGDAHHAIDALIIASLKVFRRFGEILDKRPETIIDEETGEVLEIIEDKKFFDPRYIEIVHKLSLIEKDVTKFSYKIDTKPNRQVADETICSTRNINGEYFVIRKYKNIYEEKFVTLANDILENNVEKYLMYRNSPETFKYISDIILHYAKEYRDDEKLMKNGLFVKNPLNRYYEEHHEYLHKPSKHNNGPEIISMKYTDGRLGNKIDISKNYSVDTEKKKVVLQQISPYRTDFYYSPTDGYRFVTVRYSNVYYSSIQGLYVIDKDWYEFQKKAKKIDDSFEFCFSMHRNEIIRIKKEDEDILWRFTATSNDETNRIEVKPIGYKINKQLMPAIGKKILLLEKYATDVCGNLYKVTNQELKLEFK